MKTVLIDTDEWYPIYTFMLEEGKRGDRIEVDDATLARWRHAFSAFSRAQHEMALAVAKSRRL